jgi:hypothetical protein
MVLCECVEFFEICPKKDKKYNLKFQAAKIFKENLVSNFIKRRQSS